MQRKVVTLVVLLAVLTAGSVLVLVLGGDGDDSASTIEVAQTVAPDGRPEILITVPKELNNSDTTGGRTTVDVVCRGESGQTVLRSQQVWPALNDGDPPAPHVHQAASPREIASISTCRIQGTDPPLEGRLGLAR